MTDESTSTTSIGRNNAMYATSTGGSSLETESMPTDLLFLPDFTEHPKPKSRKSKISAAIKQAQEPVLPNNDEDNTEVSFYQDFVAGGIAGSASVVVGHPFDTIKVRLQTTAASSSKGFFASLVEFGGVSSLFRGMAAPLSSAAVVNAIIFSSYGCSSRFYDEYIIGSKNDENLEDDDMFSGFTFNHDPWQKAFACGSFAGLMQSTIICPMEHVKCRLQIQHGKGAPDHKFKGPVHATRQIVQQHGLRRLYQGWWSTCWREVPAFGMYFASYDFLKDQANIFFAHQAGLQDDSPFFPQHVHTWLASSFAGGCAGCLAWAMVYPTDVIKTRIQTSPLDTAHAKLSMWNVGRSIVAQYGWRYMFRGLGVTLLRAFPVNATIFPVYEFTLQHMVSNNSFGNDGGGAKYVESY